MKKIIFLSLLTLILACQQQNPYKTEAIALNNRAVMLLDNNPDSALILLDSSFILDSSYLLPIQNKVNLLIKTERYKESVEATDQLLKKLNVPEVWQMKGLLLDKIGKSEEAQMAYKEALASFKQQLSEGKSNNKYASQYQIGICKVLTGNISEGKPIIEKNGELALQSKEKFTKILNLLDDREAFVDELLH